MKMTTAHGEWCCATMRFEERSAGGISLQWVLYASWGADDSYVEVYNGRVRVIERGVAVCWDMYRKGIENENDAPTRMVGG